MRSAHLTFAAVTLLAAGLTALVFALEPFDHGIWLLAYLLLVGFAAQFLLGRGQAALIAAQGPPHAQLEFQALLWNAGVVLVPAGVLIEARLLVVIGGIALLTALTSFARSAGETSPLRDGDSSPRQWFAQIALIGFMAISVLVGTALAWDTPWL